MGDTAQEKKLREQYRKEDRANLKKVLALLPKKYRDEASFLNRNIRVRGIEIKMTRESAGSWWGVGPKRSDRLKIELDYGLRGTVGEDKFRNRSYKRLSDGSYNYDKAAAYVVKTLDRLCEIEERRSYGKQQAHEVGRRMIDQFKTDPILGALNLEVVCTPVPKTECGEAKLIFKDEGVGHYRALEFLTTGRGEGFRGKFELVGLSAEQVMALVTILNADRLNLLDMISLADDSILGPIIKRMNEQKEDNDGVE